MIDCQAIEKRWNKMSVEARAFQANLSMICLAEPARLTQNAKETHLFLLVLKRQDLVGEIGNIDFYLTNTYNKDTREKAKG